MPMTAIRHHLIAPDRHGGRGVRARLSYATFYTLNLKCITSPSFTTYCLPSRRILLASLAPFSPLHAMKSLVRNCHESRIQSIVDGDPGRAESWSVPEWFSEHQIESAMRV